VQLSEIKTKELYRNHVAETEDVTAWELRRSIEAMLVELSHLKTHVQRPQALKKPWILVLMT
jgi:hypothetical protein